MNLVMDAAATGMTQPMAARHAGRVFFVLTTGEREREGGDVSEKSDGEGEREREK